MGGMGARAVPERAQGRSITMDPAGEVPQARGRCLRRGEWEDAGRGGNL